MPVVRAPVVAIMLVAACSTLLPQHVGAQADTVTDPQLAPRSTLQAVRRNGAVKLDGRLDEPAWSIAPAAREFTQSYPQPGAPPLDSMSVRVLYDDAALLIGVRMYDSHPDSIAAQLARRDASGIYSDWLHVIFDSYHDRRTAFRFSVNPLGVQKDVYTSNDGSEDLNWDAVWEAVARIDELGWVVEMRVPLSQLRYGAMGADENRVWGFQVMRDVARRNERDSFSPWTPQSPGFVSSFGDLTGLENLNSPRRLEILPYVSAKAVREPGSSANPFYHSTDFTPSVGGDVRYGLPGGLTLTGTINPDFGQVEVDPAVVNLTAFETFFPEKRPFFLEGSDVFSFGEVRTQNSFNNTRFLYSRRIGHAPVLGQSLEFDPDIAWADAPEQTRILGAVKVTGKRGDWTIGVLDALTSREEARIVTTAGARGQTPVEPRTNYFAARIRRDLRAGQTVIGAMLTNTARDLGDAVFRPLLAERASFGGVDFEHSWNQRSWYLSGYAGASRVDGGSQMIASLQRNSRHQYQRPDADYLHVDAERESLSGYIGEIALQKTGEVFGSVSWKDASPGFDVNDFGFHGRVDYRALSSLIGYASSERGDWFRQQTWILYQNSAWNHGGSAIFNALNARGFVTLNNFWTASLGGGIAASAYSDRLTRGGPLSRSPRGWNASANVGSDSRRPIVASASLFHSRDQSGARSTSGSIELSARPATNLSLSFGPSLSVSESTSQFVRAQPDALAAETFGTRYVFADLNQTIVSLDTRIEWTLTPTLSLQTYVQPFVAVGRFERFKEFALPGSYDFDLYGTDRGTIVGDADTHTFTIDPDGAAGAAAPFVIGDPTFNSRSLRGNAVVRWQYRPGSALYFVWQQQRSAFEPISDFDASRDIGAIFETRPTNVFLVKATYWFSP